MSESVQPTTTTSLIQIEPIVRLIQEFIPDADTKTGKAAEALKSITVIEDDDDVEYASELLVKVKASYDKFSAMRKQITEPLDQLKQELMQYEKRVSYDGKTDNEYTRVRNLIQSFKQAELDKKNKAEQEAEARRKKEDYKVQLETQVKKNLTQMVIDRVVEADEGSRKFFDATTLLNFDEEAKKFNTLKPHLKQDRYDQCFKIPFDESILSKEEFDSFINNHVKFVEDFEKWKELVIDGMTPILNEWRAKIPVIKEEKIALSKAKDDAERLRMEDEQKKRALEEENRKKSEMERLRLEANQQIDQEADVNKLHNAFQQQGSVQELGVKGPVKYIIRFNDDKMMVRALANIIYHCFLSAKFPGVFKKNRQGEVEVDEHGNKQYVAHIQWWLDFFMTHCDVKIPGTEVKEVAKVIVRK